MKTKTGIYVFGANDNKEDMIRFMFSLGFVEYEPCDDSNNTTLPKNNVIFISTHDDTDEFNLLKGKLVRKFNIQPSEVFEFSINSSYIPSSQDVGEPLMLL